MTALEDVDPADEARSFRRQPGWQRMIVIGAGSFMHFLLAFVLLFILALGIGQATNSSSSTIGAIEPCVPKSETAATCVKSDPASPAVKSGFRTGDKIVALAGQPVHNWDQLGAAIRAQPAGTPVAVTVLRDGHRLTLHPSLATIHGRKGSYLGISPAIVYPTVGPVSAVRYAGLGVRPDRDRLGVGPGRHPEGHPGPVRQGPEQHRGRQRDQRGRRGGVHRRGVRRPGGLAGQGDRWCCSSSSR